MRPSSPPLGPSKPHGGISRSLDSAREAFEVGDSALSRAAHSTSPDENQIGIDEPGHKW